MKLFFWVTLLVLICPVRWGIPEESRVGEAGWGGLEASELTHQEQTLPQSRSGRHLGRGSSLGRPTRRKTSQAAQDVTGGARRHRRRHKSCISSLQPLDGSGAPSPPGRDIQKWLPGGKHVPVETHGSRERDCR